MAILNRNCFIFNLSVWFGPFPDCSELFDDGRTHPVLFSTWSIHPDGAPAAFLTSCYLQWGGWTVFQHRHNDPGCPSTREDFYRGWQDYKKGFGTLGCDFWLGNDNLHWLTSQKNYRLDVAVSPDDQSDTYYQGGIGYLAIGYTVIPFVVPLFICCMF